MRMNRRTNIASPRIGGVRKGVLAAILAALALFGLSAQAQAAEPFYAIKATWGDTLLPPGGEGQFTLQVRNSGQENGSGPMTVEDQLPAGVTVTGFEGGLASTCSGVGTGLAKCEFMAEEAHAQAPGTFGALGLIPRGFLSLIFVNVAVDPGASGTGTNLARVSGGGAAQPATDTDPVSFGATPSAFGIVPGSFSTDVFDGEYPFGGSPLRQAGAHPYELRVNFDLNEKSAIDDEGQFAEFTRYTTPHGRVRDVEVTLPRGLIGNPEATPQCDPTAFASFGVNLNSTQCPSDTQVGYLQIWFANGKHNHGYGGFSTTGGHANLTYVPIYNLKPPVGVPADFAFNAGGAVQAHIYPTLDPAQSYAIKTVTPDISDLLSVRGSEVTFWGVPADPAHDRWRYFTGELAQEPGIGAPFGSAAIKPLLTNPMDCGFDNGGARIRTDSYNDPGNYTPIEEYANADNVEGCDDLRFRFEPDIALQPTDRDAGAPTGLDVHLEVPQRNEEVANPTDLYTQNGAVKALPTPPLKKAVVTFPKGMTLNPGGAQGLGSCSPAQIGLGTDSPVSCPDNSQYGKLTLHTPLLPINAQPEGWVYIAKQNDNPFHNFLSFYLVIQEPDRGILVKIPGRVDLNQETGQITATFDDLPQFPVSDMQMNLKGGLRAGLVNPQTCGRKTIEATFYSWQDPQTPHTVNSSYDVTKNPDGSPCHSSLSERPFDPHVAGGTVSNLAGSYSPMELTLSRSDEDQELSKVEGTAPPGLLASLKGVGRCTDAAIAAAATPGRTGTEEIEHPSCPASSQVGTVDAGAGVGQILTYVHGRVYLAGPYKGAPVSGVVIVPAVAGPFDVGTIVTRAPGYVNPKTAELHLVSDPLPLIFQGIPVRVRDIRVHLNRPHFILNPTNCDPFALSGTLFSSEGKQKTDTTPFQVADCASLGFKPKLTTQLFGGTHRGAHPKFRGTFKAREGDANVSGAVITLPHSEFLDQANIRTVCTRVQFAAGGGNGEQCPAASIYGHATAKTPLLDEELQGPVYLRSSDHKLPDLVADLHGIVDVEVAGRIDSINGGIRANFESIPDAPVESFTITMQGGNKGLLVNSRDICAHKYRIDAEFKGQNGKEAALTPKLRAACRAKRKAKQR
jgi:uncharacterized repeat protein (TIGR01451 family)